MKTEVGNLAIVPQIKPSSAWRARDENEVVRMLVDLQTTLDIAQLLRLFSGHLRDFVPHMGYGFRNEILGIDLVFGHDEHHCCRYLLKLEDETLGEWRIRRDRPFSSADLERMEVLLTHLVYPLRNCLRYQEAVCYAHTDPLTQVGNRAALLSSLPREIEGARRYGQPFALIFLDIDHFKSINDTYGHDAGDAVLRSVAQNIKETVRSSDGVYRFGGEEFVIMFSNVGQGGAENLAERLRQAVAAQAHRIEGEALRVTVSLGVAMLNPGESPSALMNRADQAMYKAKRSGRNRVEVAAQE